MVRKSRPVDNPRCLNRIFGYKVVEGRCPTFLGPVILMSYKGRLVRIVAAILAIQDTLHVSNMKPYNIYNV